MQTLDQFDYQQRLAETRGEVLVLLTSPTCGTCRRVESLLAGGNHAHRTIYKVDVQENPAIARALDVFHLPSLFLYMHGNYHARLDCEITPAALDAAIRIARANPPEEEP